MAANAARRAMSISEEQPAIFTMYQYIFIDIKCQKSQDSITDGLVLVLLCYETPCLQRLPHAQNITE